MIGNAYTKMYRHIDAISLAQNWPNLANSMLIISRLITAQTYASRFEDAIESWMKYKQGITFDKFDPFMIANLLFCYNILGRQKEALDEFQKWFTLKGKGGDNGLMKFNAACLYSICEDWKNSLRMLSLALDEGKDRESILSEKELEYVRQKETFVILMAQKPVQVLTLEIAEPSQYIEIVLEEDEVTIRQRSDKEDLDSCEKIRQDFDNYVDAIIFYLEKRDEYLNLGYRKTDPFCIQYWTEEFVKNLQKIKDAQDSNELPKLGVMIVEWDYENSPCEINLWTGFIEHCNDPNADDTYFKYVYGDEIMADDSFEGPYIDTAEQFEMIVRNIIQTNEYKTLQKETPFYFVYQEHDSGHIHTHIYIFSKSNHRFESLTCG